MERKYKNMFDFFKQYRKILLSASIYYLVISAICLIFKVHFIISTTLFILLPAAILVHLKKNAHKEFTLFVFSLGIPMGLFCQVIAERNNMWKYDPFFDRLYAFNMPLEAIFWYPAWFALVVATYLYFFDGHKHMFTKNFLVRHFKYFAFVSILTIVGLLLIQLEQQYVQFPFPYISIILPLALVSLVMYSINRHKHFFKTLVPTVLLLAIPMLLYDLIGVYSHQWTFPGDFLYQIDFGFAKLPVEEFIIWIFIWPASVIAYFEEFDKDLN